MKKKDVMMDIAYIVVLIVAVMAAFAIGTECAVNEENITCVVMERRFGSDYESQGYTPVIVDFDDEDTRFDVCIPSGGSEFETVSVDMNDYTIVDVLISKIKISLT